MYNGTNYATVDVAFADLNTVISIGALTRVMC
jgi:hypothetical protein